MARPVDAEVSVNAHVRVTDHGSLQSGKYAVCTVRYLMVLYISLIWRRVDVMTLWTQTRHYSAVFHSFECLWTVHVHCVNLIANMYLECFTGDVGHRQL